MKLLIFDSNSIINRAFYGIKLLSTKDGQFTNAVYGFFNITLKLIDDLAPDQVVFAFDLRAPTFRHKLYDGYKAQRKGMPEELAQQLPVVKELILAMGYPIVECEGFEADDVLGTFAKAAQRDGNLALL
ncbi:MAG: DNA polymerase I, partial [Angelakisella sp.]